MVVCIHVPGRVQNKPVDILLDTGSSATLLNSNLWEQIKAPNQNLSSYSGSFVSINGDPLKILGCQDVEICLGGIRVVHKVFVVENIMQLCLVGTDFLRKHRVSIEMDRCQVKAGGVIVPIGLGEKPLPQICDVTIANTIQIEGHHEAVIQGCVGNGENFKSCDSPEGVIEGNFDRSFNEDIVIARVLVSAHENVVPLRLVNLSPNPVTLYQGMKVGHFVPLLPEELELNDGYGYHILQKQEVQKVQSVSKPKQAKVLGSKLFDLDKIEIDSDDKCALVELLDEFSDIFSTGPDDIGRTDQVLHKIDTGDASPIRERPRRLPHHRQKEVESHLEKMNTQGIIQPSTSPWAAPIVLVGKKDGTTRFCVDYRRLNQVTKKDAYPLPRIDDTLDQMSGATLFSTLDLASGYWQVELDPSDKEKSAFVTCHGLC